MRANSITQGALLIIDVQNDFLPDGALPVPKSDEILPIINKLLTLPFKRFIASLDWHPPHHVSFAQTHGKNVGEKIDLREGEQLLWPVHCVASTWGSELSPKWRHERIDHRIYKGTDPLVDSYSAFFDNHHQKKSDLENYLKTGHISTIYLVGLATDFCVLFTALDALDLGFEVFIIEDGCRAVRGDLGRQEAYQKIVAHGGKVTSMNELYAHREGETRDEALR